MNEQLINEGLFDNRKYLKINFTGLLLHGTEFLDCLFEKCDFSNSVFRFCKFSGCVFNDCDLSLISVNGSSFFRTKFLECKLVGVNWTKADWRTPATHQLVEAIEFTKCNLNLSSFTGLNLQKCRFQECLAREVDFSETNLSGADFRETDLAGSQFRGTNLTDANLIGTKNYTIIPTQAKLKNTRVALPEAMSFLENIGLVFYDEGLEKN